MTCYVWISRQQLTAACACPDGLALFESLAAMQGRRGKVRVRWDALSYLWLERETGFASWLYGHGIVPMPSFAYVNLARADLTGANLAGAYLADAYLAGACLADAYLAGAYLAGACLGNWERGPDGYARRKAVA